MYARTSLAIALCSLIISGCGPAVEPVEVDTGETTEIAEWMGFIPAYFGVTDVAFGYDLATLQAVPAVTESEGVPEMLPISITVVILDATALSGFNASNHCEVVMTSTSPLPRADWASDAGAWFAFDMPTSASSSTNCGELEFDPAVWGTEPESQVTKWTWGAGINPLTQDAIDVMGSDFTAMEPWVHGGGFYWEELPNLKDGESVEGTDGEKLPYDADGYVDVGITFAYEMDADLKLVLAEDEKVLIPGAAIPQPDDNVLTAYYEVQVNRFLKPVQHLVQELE